MALPLIYKSCLMETSFDSGIEERIRFLKESAEIKREREEKEQQYNERINEMKENGEEDIEEEIEAFEKEKAEWEELIEPEFKSIEKKFVVCLDTMGQDRELDIKEREYLDRIVQLFANSWETNEKKQLSDDIDNQINYLNSIDNNPVEIWFLFINIAIKITYNY